jgi:hypothetical protein
VNSDSSFLDSVHDPPRVLEDLEPGPIAERPEFGRHVATSGMCLERLATRDDPIEDLVVSQRRFVDEVGGQAFDVPQGYFRPDDGVPAVCHLRDDAFFRFRFWAALARRRTSAVE